VRLAVDELLPRAESDSEDESASGLLARTTPRWLVKLAPVAT
jgi:hypothetical protein